VVAAAEKEEEDEEDEAAAATAARRLGSDSTNLAGCPPTKGKEAQNSREQGFFFHF